MSQESVSVSLFLDKEKEERFSFLSIRAWLSLVLILPIAFSPFHRFDLFLSPGIQGVCATILQCFCACPFYLKAYQSLKRKELSSDLLISISTTCSYLLGFYFLFSNPERMLYFEISSFLVVAALWQVKIERSLKRREKRELEEFEALQPSIICITRDNRLVEVSSEEVQIGEICFIRPGETIPLDAVVQEGASRVDESALTGEKMAVEKKVGSLLFAGTRNGYGLLRAKVSTIKSQTTLKQIVSLIQKNQRTFCGSQGIAKKTTHYLTLVSLCSGFGIWMAFALGIGSPVEGMMRAIAIWAVVCPAVLLSSVSFLLFLGMTKLARNGILMTSYGQFEEMAKMKTLIIEARSVALQGHLELEKMELDRDYLPLIKALCLQFEHPLSEILLTWMREELVPSIPSMLIGFRLYPGEGGVSGYFDGRKYFFGTPRFLMEHQVPVPDLQEKGEVILAFGLEKLFLGYFLFTQQIKEKTCQGMKELQTLKVKTILTTVDPILPLDALAKKLNPDVVEENWEKIQQMLPSSYGKVVESDLSFLWMHKGGHATTFQLSAVGESIVLKEGTVALMHQDLKAVSKAIAFSKNVFKKIEINKFFVLSYSGLGMILAAKGYLHPLVSPLWAVVNILFVVFYSNRIEKAKINNDNCLR